MSKVTLLAVTVLLLLIPGVAFLLFGGGASQAIALVLICLAGLAASLGFVGSGGGVLKIVWLVLGVCLVGAVLSDGYLSIFAQVMSLDRTQSTELAFSTLAVEVSSVVAMAFSGFRKYSRNWTKDGYEESEIDSEWNRLGGMILGLGAGAAVCAVGIYFLLDFLPSVPIDPITALVIATAVCFVVAQLVLQRRKDEKEPSRERTIQPWS